MRKEEFYFDSSDGLNRIHGVCYTPDTEEVSGVVQVIHGMAEYAERYEEFAAYLTERNFVVVGEDHLGHGKTVGDKGKKGYFCPEDPATALVEDCYKLQQLTREKYAGVPYYILGHSMGSFILRVYLCRYGGSIDGAILMGTGSQPGWLLKVSKGLAAVLGKIQGDRHASGLLNKAAFGAYNSRIKQPETEFDWLSRDRERVAAYVADPDCGFCFTINGFAALFELISRAQSSIRMKNIPKELPILVVSGEADPVGGYGAGVRQVADALTEAGLQDVTMKLYPQDRHEVLNERDRVRVMEDLYSWITEKGISKIA